MSSLKFRLAGVTALIALAVTGCSSSSSGKSTPSPTAPSSLKTTGDNGGGTTKVAGTITVYAAASLTEAFNTLKTQFQTLYPGTTITIQYGASSDLATRISQGAPVDVFASASEKNMKQIGSAAVGPQDFASNTAEIAIPPSNPGKITQLSDLAKAGKKVAVCAPAVPCGVVAAQVFKNAKITVKASANPADVKSTLALVESGEVDAGIVYVTDVRSAGTKVKGIVIPDKDNAKTTYPIAKVKSSKNQAVADAWIQYVLGVAGQKVLKADGFSKP